MSSSVKKHTNIKNMAHEVPNTPSVDALMTGITDVFQAHVSAFATRLSETTQGQVSVESIIAVWNSVSDVQLQASAPDRSVKPVPKKSRGRATNPNGLKCVYVFRKGANRDNECGSNVPDEEGRTMCNRHKKHEGTPQGVSEVSDVSAAAKPAARGNSAAKPAARGKLTIVKDKKTGNYIHPPTNIVFDKKTKSAVGVQDENGEIVLMSADDVKAALKLNFKIAPGATEDEHRAGEEEEEEEEEVVEEEDPDVEEEEEEVVEEEPDDELED